MIKKYGFVWLEAAGGELYFCEEHNKWYRFDDRPSNAWVSSSMNVHSLRAAKRHLRKHEEIPKGTEFMLVNKYVGYDLKLVKE